MKYAETIHDIVAATLCNVGLCQAPASLIHTILLRDGRFVGHKYRFDGGYAAWVVATNVIEVYGDDGKLVKTIVLTRSEGGEAA
jgi:hypothetical protein